MPTNLDYRHKIITECGKLPIAGNGMNSKTISVPAGFVALYDDILDDNLNSRAIYAKKFALGYLKAIPKCQK